MLRRWPGTPNVELITTDGFLYPLAELKRRQLLERKGFPESYDRCAPPRFVSEIKGGAEEVRAPWYSHVTYDIVPDKEVVVRRPDVLIVEGLNVLAPARPRHDGRQGLALSDFFDFSIYVDAPTSYIEEWYMERFRKLQSTAFAQPESYFHRYATLSEAEARRTARDIWKRIKRAQPGGKRPPDAVAARSWCCPRMPTIPFAACSCGRSSTHVPRLRSCCLPGAPGVRWYQPAQFRPLPRQPVLD